MRSNFLLPFATVVPDSGGGIDWVDEVRGSRDAQDGVVFGSSIEYGGGSPLLVDIVAMVEMVAKLAVERRLKTLV